MNLWLISKREYKIDNERRDFPFCVINNINFFALHLHFFSFDFHFSSSFQIYLTQLCHVLAECFSVPTANAYHKFGCVTIKRTVRRARMNFSHVLHPTVKMASLVVVDMSLIRHIVFHHIISVT